MANHQQTKFKQKGTFMEYNIYCDESCHLEHDESNAMTIGGIWCPKSSVKDINNRIREIKARNNFRIDSEAKWTKICPKNKELYIDLINLFFDMDNLKLRCVLIPDKTSLDHQNFKQTHNDWYYKMYFTMLKYIFENQHTYNVYIDIKDTHSYYRAQELHAVCCHAQYDFSGDIIKKIQPIRSQELEIMQLVDILIGAIAYENRLFSSEHTESTAKREIISLIKERSGYTLQKTTLLREEKFNVFVWEAKQRSFGL